jgi:hypothetical protein
MGHTPEGRCASNSLELPKADTWAATPNRSARDALGQSGERPGVRIAARSLVVELRVKYQLCEAVLACDKHCQGQPVGSDQATVRRV